MLVDQGFEDSEDLSAKALLAMKLNALVAERGLTQSEVAAITGMSQFGRCDRPLEAIASTGRESGGSGIRHRSP